MKKHLFLSLLCLSFSIMMTAQTKTIHVTPDNAKIFVDGNEVGNGHYSLKFNRKTDYFVIKFKAPGYLDKQVKLFKTNPNKTISYTLAKDEFSENSIGPSGNAAGVDNIDVANKWFDVVCKEGFTGDQIWKRLMSIASRNFQNVEIRDKAAGWIRTAWSKTFFTSQVARTRLEIKINTDDENELSYRVKIHSEINNDPECVGDQCFEASDRILKKYIEVINELQNKLE